MMISVTINDVMTWCLRMRWIAQKTDEDKVDGMMQETAW